MDTTTCTSSDPRALLVDAAQCLVDRDDADIRLLVSATRWADVHPLPDDEEPGVFTDTDLRLTGEGVPTVANAAVAEFAAALRMSTAAGEYLVAEAMELRHRLPRIWAGLLQGEVRPRRARDIAQRTLALSKDAATYVDQHLSHLTDRLSTVQIERTATAAILRHMPERAAEHAARKADPRGAWFDHHQGDEWVGPQTRLSAVLDLPDGLQLDAAVADGARQLKQLGVDGHDQALRSIALADLARRQTALPTDITDSEYCAATDSERPVTRPGKPVTVYLHLGDDAIIGGQGVCRYGNLNLPVALELVRRWLGDPAAHITIKPVIDLNEPIEVDAYEIPDRIREHVTLREPCCVFPWCHKPSTAPGVDLDHIVPYAAGGATSTENLAPLCRSHHRLKTHTRWRYHRDPDGIYVWTSPRGLVFRRQRDGTISETDRPPPTPPEQRDLGRTTARRRRRRRPRQAERNPIVDDPDPWAVDDTPPPF